VCVCVCVGGALSGRLNLRWLRFECLLLCQNGIITRRETDCFDSAAGAYFFSLVCFLCLSASSLRSASSPVRNAEMKRKTQRHHRMYKVGGVAGGGGGDGGVKRTVSKRATTPTEALLCFRRHTSWYRRHMKTLCSSREKPQGLKPDVTLDVSF